jgi:hypothetical protein
MLGCAETIFSLLHDRLISPQAAAGHSIPENDTGLLIIAAAQVKFCWW